MVENVQAADVGRPAAAGPTPWPARARAIRWLSVALLATGLGLSLGALPVGTLLARAHAAVGDGSLGLVGFGTLYVAFALLLVPGAALTLAAGALFGPVRGLVLVSLASTTAAALAFLVGRHVARARVEALAQRYAGFRAVDRAIAEGGWKVVALLRLSPAMPFSVENYLFGLTAVRFWPYVAASWAFMLPGTALYVWLGHAGRTAAAGSRSPAEWLLMAAGLAATAGVTLYLTRTARRLLALERVPAESRPAAPHGGTAPGAAPSPALAVTAVLALGLGIGLYSNKARLRLVAGPPVVAAQEAYAADVATTTFDHSALDGLLRRHVGPDGEVDYRGLRREAPVLDGYLGALAEAPFDALGRDEKLALLIDAYNAFTLRLILDHWPIASIKDIPSGERWSARRFRLAGRVYSLDDLEHEQTRPKFREPRVHFALVCAARGCPPLRAEAYVGSRLDEQLDQQARYVHSHERWLRFDPATRTLYLTPLYRWYGGDFEQTPGGLLGFVGRYVPQVRSAQGAGQRPRVQWLPYDWSLNGKAGEP